VKTPNIFLSDFLAPYSWGLSYLRVGRLTHSVFDLLIDVLIVSPPITAVTEITLLLYALSLSMSGYLCDSPSFIFSVSRLASRFIHSECRVFAITLSPL